jgi:hypothetical protein
MLVFRLLYARFLSNRSSIKTPSTMMTTNRPAIAGMKYVSETDGGVSVGAAVGSGAAATTA